MNRYVRPVQFAFEPDVVTQFTKFSVGAASAVTLDTKNSKGVCNIGPASFVIRGTLTLASPVISAVVAADFSGLRVGMVLSGTNITPGTTILSFNVGAGTITMSANAIAGLVNAVITATATAASGEMTITFGSQYAPFKRLDSYVKLLGMSYIITPAATLAPAAPYMYLVRNDISNAAMASITVQFGFYTGAAFTSAATANGETVQITTQLCRSSAI